MASNSRESMIPPKTLLVSWLARLYTHKLTTTTGGNLSLIDDDGDMYITPSGGDKAFVPPEDVAVLRCEKHQVQAQQSCRNQHHHGEEHGVVAQKCNNNNDENKGDWFMGINETDFEGSRKPSIEWPLHTAVYKVRPGCRAVLHAHSMSLVAFSLADQRKFASSTSQVRHQGSHNNGSHESDDEYDVRTPDTRCLLSAYQSCGRVIFAPYAMPGSMELANVCATTLQKYPHATCLILQNHGVLTIGCTLQEAYDRFVSLECLARSIVNAVPLGVLPRPLSDDILRAVNSSPSKTTPLSMPITSGNDNINGISCYGEKKTEAEDKDEHNKIFPRPIPQCASTGCCSCQSRIVTELEKQVRTDICKFVHRAYSQNLVTSSSGSFSVKLIKAKHFDDGKNGEMSSYDKLSADDELSFLITPTKVDRKNLEPSDICFVSKNKCCRHDEKCDVVASSKTSSPPSSHKRRRIRRHKRRRIDVSCNLRYHPIHHPHSPEHVCPSRAAPIHATIYAEHPEITCIMVVQPPFATSFCVTGEPFDASGIPEALIVLHDVKKVPFESILVDQGKEVSRILDPKKGVNTILITGYGLLTVGTGGMKSCLLKTFVQLECCENMCGVYLTAKSRGHPHLLTPAQVRDINNTFYQGH